MQPECSTELTGSYYASPVTFTVFIVQLFQKLFSLRFVIFNQIYSVAVVNNLHFFVIFSVTVNGILKSLYMKQKQRLVNYVKIKIQEKVPVGR